MLGGDGSDEDVMIYEQVSAKDAELGDQTSHSELHTTETPVPVPNGMEDSVGQSTVEAEVIPPDNPLGEPWKTIEEMLSDLKAGKRPMGNTEMMPTDKKLENWKDMPKLRHAQAALTVRSKDKVFDVFFRACLSGMVGMLNLFLSPNLNYTWREASLITSRAQGHGEAHARNLHTWMHQYLNSDLETLPCH
ncbi:hypothetical protein BDQ17DRAFT_1431811 [Cyathus striatus]|nr:hypothetical protein BDQ17DRAFT_1431811 [Cyathus striatus]